MRRESEEPSGGREEGCEGGREGGRERGREGLEREDFCAWVGEESATQHVAGKGKSIHSRVEVTEGARETPNAQKMRERPRERSGVNESQGAIGWDQGREHAHLPLLPGLSSPSKVMSTMGAMFK
jgi:hypothetical protein